MTLDELIEKLEALQEQGFGSLDVVTDKNQQVYAVEYSGDHPPAIVIEFS